ncbi:MAG: tetratricopeptide repeat protein [Coleofasciculaceae cyanobacterium SM2_1_6]|nr:tetratricopeptide repeat protein [Coleofasciculaceae cyanobacterium SM2_1_6]
MPIFPDLNFSPKYLSSVTSSSKFSLVSTLSSSLYPSRLLVILMAIALVSLAPQMVSAQGNPQNPLEITETDPLLPPEANSRELTDLERRDLITALTELEQQGNTFLEAGDFENTELAWNRLLRLSRSLGTIEEIQTLGRIGNLAWSRDLSQQVNIISTRLQRIQQEAVRRGVIAENPTPNNSTPDNSPEKLDIPLLQALGTAYQQLRSPNLAIPIYQQLLTYAQATQNINATENYLRTLGVLHMDWFDYTAAASTYQELFKFAVSIDDLANQVIYLEELAYIYDQLKDQENSIATRQELLTYYQTKLELQPKIPSLLIEIASSYSILRNPQAARDHYQKAYEVAIAGKLYAAARDALQGLATLYQTYNQPDTALEIYQILVQVNQQSYDTYFSMRAYDQMGQIHLQRSNYAQALAMFTEGLKIARTLQTQELYFAAQVERSRNLLSAN